LTAEQIEDIQRQAHEEGFELGRGEGLTAGKKELQARVQRLEAVMAALAQPLKDLDDAIEEELLALAMAVARQLVRREIKTDPGQIVAVVREALAVLPAASRRVRLHLHPDDAALVRDALSVPEGDNAWRIMEDPVLTRGGCRIITETSQVDATLESRLNAVITSVLGGERDSDESS
jgi:flagellar assembly protein FliH